MLVLTRVRWLLIHVSPNIIPIDFKERIGLKSKWVPSSNVGIDLNIPILVLVANMYKKYIFQPNLGIGSF
jgi:hypothetical protein